MYYTEYLLKVYIPILNKTKEFVWEFSQKIIYKMNTKRIKDTYEFSVQVSKMFISGKCIETQYYFKHFFKFSKIHKMTKIIINPSIFGIVRDFWFLN